MVSARSCSDSGGLSDCFGASLLDESRSFRPSSLVEGRRLAVRVFGSAFVERDQEIETSLEVEAKAFSSKSNITLKVSDVFGPNPISEVDSVSRMRVSEPFQLNRDGCLIWMRKGIDIEIGPSTSGKIRLSADEAEFYKKRGYITGG